MKKYCIQSYISVLTSWVHTLSCFHLYMIYFKVFIYKTTQQLWSNSRCIIWIWILKLCYLFDNLQTFLVSFVRHFKLIFFSMIWIWKTKQWKHVKKYVLNSGVTYLSCCFVECVKQHLSFLFNTQNFQISIMPTLPTKYEMSAGPLFWRHKTTTTKNLKSKI